MARAPQARQLDPREFPPEQRKLVEALSSVVTDVGNLFAKGITFDGIRGLSADLQIAAPPNPSPAEFAGNWTAFSPVSYQRTGNRVFLDGIVYGGTYGATPIFTLPLGFHPAQTQVLYAVQSSLFTPAGLLEISTTGEVVAPTVTSVQSGTSAYLSLAGLSFETADAPVSPGAPFPLLVKTPFKPQEAFVTGCWDSVGDPAPLPVLTWGVVLSGTELVLSVLALDGLIPESKYTVRLAVLGF